MAKALPVVVTDVDGFKEVVVNNYNGIIVERKNTYEIAKALEKLVLNSELRKIYGENGRERVLKYFNWKDNVSIMEKLYEEVLHERDS
jgi:Glycosyltransferase